MKTTLAVLVAVWGAFALNAETFVWTGAEDAYWTNAANWKVEGGADPATRCPGSVLMEDKDAQWAAFVDENDTVVFDETGVKPANYIDLDGHLAVKTSIFRGDMATAYVFGCTAYNSTGQMHPEWYDFGHFSIKSGGSMTFESTLTQAPTFKSGITPSQGDAGQTTFINNSAVTFSLGTFFGMIAHRETKSNYWPEHVFQGTGAFSLPFYTANGTTFNQFSFQHDGLTTITGGIGGISKLTFEPMSSGAVRQVNVASGGSLGFNGHTWTGFNANGDTRIYGAGAVSISGRADDSPSFGIAAGKTLTFDQKTLSVTGSRAYWWLGAGAGTLCLGTNVLNAKVTCDVRTKLGTLAVQTVGMAGAAAPLGTGSRVYVDAGKAFAYVGEGETTDRILVVTNFKSAANSTATLAQRGTGDLVFGGVESLPKSGKTNTIILENDTAFGATLASPLANGADGTLAVTKTGSGIWTISGENTYTGTTTLQGGTLALDTTQSLGPLVVNGAAALAIPDGVTITVSALSRTSGTLDVRTTGTGKLIVTGATFGAAEAWLTINGSAVNFQADGSVSAADHTWVPTVSIPARGGVVPATATANDVVGVTTDGEPEAGPITVEAAAGATLAGFTQKTAADATVSLADGQTLAAKVIGAEPGKGDLAFTGAGTVAGTGAKLTLDVADADQNVSIASAFAPSGAQIIKTGAGTATLPKTGDWRGRIQLTDGTVKLGTDAADQLVLKADGEATPIVDVYAGDASTTITNRPNDGVALEVTGTSTTPLKLYVDGADTRITGADTSVVLGHAAVEGYSALNLTSRLEVVDGAYVLATNQTTVGANGGNGFNKKQTGILVVSNATYQGRIHSPGNFYDRTDSLVIGSVYGDGEVYIEDGAVISNRLYMGVFDYYGSGRTHASLFQRGGKATFGQRNQIGHFGYSYVEQLGGELNFIGETRIGTRTANGSHNIGSAVMAFYGGSATALNGLNYIGMSSGFGDKYYHVDDFFQYAGIYLKGGSLRCGTNLYLGNGLARINFTVAHPDSYWSGNSLRLTGSPGGRGIHVNANAGQLQLVEFKRDETGAAYLNLNGGTLYALCGNKGSLSTGVFDRRTVYENGFTFAHFNNWDGTLAGPFQAAPGKGVVAVEIPDDLKGKPFVTSPIVEIEGDGTGATAVAEFDSYTHQVTNIAVTSHGWDYTWAKAILVYSPRETNRTDLVCTLADNKRGPFIYRGLGDDTNRRNANLRLTGENEFSAVVVLGGTLRAGSEKAIPWDADVVLSNSCTLAMSTNTVRFGSLSGLTGTITSANTNAQNVLTVLVDRPAACKLAKAVNSGAKDPKLNLVASGAWTLTGAEIAAGNYPTCGQNFTFADGSSITVTDVAGLDPEARYTLFEVTDGKTLSGVPAITVPEGWKVSKIGNKLRFSKPKGLLLLVR